MAARSMALVCLPMGQTLPWAFVEGWVLPFVLDTCTTAASLWHTVPQTATDLGACSSERGEILQEHLTQCDHNHPECFCAGVEPAALLGLCQAVHVWNSQCSARILLLSQKELLNYLCLCWPSPSARIISCPQKGAPKLPINCYSTDNSYRNGGIYLQFPELLTLDSHH